MKNNGACIKCNDHKIIRIPGNTTKQVGDNAIPHGWLKLGSVPVTRYLCCNCGYSEEWVDNPVHIQKLEKSYDNHELDDYV